MHSGDDPHIPEPSSRGNSSPRRKARTRLRRTRFRKRSRKLIAIGSRILLGFAAILLTVYLLFLIPGVQGWAAQRAASWLSNKTGSEVNVERVRMRLVKSFDLGGVEILEPTGDTLLAVDDLIVEVGLFDPFKRQFHISKVEAKGMHFMMKRNLGDSLFTFSHFTQALSSGEAKTDKTKSGKPWSLDLKRLSLVDTRFKFYDIHTQTYMDLDIRNADIKLDEVDFDEQFVNAEHIEFRGLQAAFWKSNEPRGERRPIKEVPRLNNSGWHFATNELSILESDFTFNDNRKAPEGGLDFNHMDIRQINLQASQVDFNADTILAQMTRMTAYEQSGAEITRLTGDLRLTNKNLRLENMDLRTPNSYIGDSIYLEYYSFHGFENYPYEVDMNARLRDSRVAVEDLDRFAPGLSELLQGDMTISGEVRGTVDNLRGRNIDLRYGKQSRFEGRFDVTGLMDAQESFIEFRIAELATNSNDLERLLPGVDFPESFPELGQFKVEGEFIGFPKDFVAYGSATTAIGDLNSDLNLKVDPGANTLTYSGNFSLGDFDLGTWLGDPELLGRVTASSGIKGTGLAKGLDIANANANLDASVQSLVFKGYAYNELAFEGQLEEGFFSGKLESADPNFDQTFEGSIDFRPEDPLFDFNSDIRRIDFYALKLVPYPLSLRTDMTLNMEGDNIDSILGSARLRNVTLVDSLGEHYLDSLIVSAREDLRGRHLRVESDAFDARFDGNFGLTLMPDAVARLVDHYFPGAGVAYDSAVADQDLQFDLDIRDTRELTRLFLPFIGRVQDAKIDGSFNSIDNRFSTRATFPNVSVAGIQFSDLGLDIQTGPERIDLFSRAREVQVSDSLILPVSVVEGTYRDDSLALSTLIGRDTDSDRLNLHSIITAVDSAFAISILPSEMVLRNKQWSISPNNSLEIEPGDENTPPAFRASNFEFSSGQQRITLTAKDTTGYRSWLNIDLENVILEDVLYALHRENMGLGGKVTGTLAAGDPLARKTKLTGFLFTEDFSIDRIVLGNLRGTAALDRPGDKLSYIAQLEGQNRFISNGDIWLSKPNAPLDAELRVQKLDVAPFARYLNGLFDNVEGGLAGNFDLKGSLKEPVITGSAKLSEASLRLVYLDVAYDVPSLDLVMDEDRLMFQRALVMDEEGNRGYVSGAMRYTTLVDWAFDSLQVSTPFMLMMNTSRAENPDFYGIGYGSGRVVIDGPLNQIKVAVQAQTRRGTDVTIPVLTGPTVGSDDFVHFIDRSKKGEDNPVIQTTRGSRVDFELQLDVTEDAEVVIDLGDRLSGKGRGDLTLLANSGGDFSMSGIFLVTEGNYAFTLPGAQVIGKDFTIDQFSRITWTGDPYEAQLDVSAVYQTRTAPWELVAEFEASMTDEEVRALRDRQDIDVYLQLTGPLSSPNIDFDIVLPQGQGGQLTLFEREIQEIKADKNELNKQVFGLLVMNQFIPDETGITPLISGASTSVSEFLTKQLSVYFSDWLSSFITDVDVDVNLYNYTGIDQLTQQEVEVAVSKRFYDDRIYVNFGGSFGLGETDPTDPAAGTVAGDFEIQYAITADGRVKVSAFQRTDYDVLQQRNIGKTGVGIFYSQEFDSLYDLVTQRRDRREKRKREREEGAVGQEGLLPEEGAENPNLDPPVDPLGRGNQED